MTLMIGKVETVGAMRKLEYRDFLDCNATAGGTVEQAEDRSSAKVSGAWKKISPARIFVVQCGEKGAS